MHPVSANRTFLLRSWNDVTLSRLWSDLNSLSRGASTLHEWHRWLSMTLHRSINLSPTFLTLALEGVSRYECPLRRLLCKVCRSPAGASLARGRSVPETAPHPSLPSALHGILFPPSCQSKSQTLPRYFQARHRGFLWLFRNTHTHAMFLFWYTHYFTRQSIFPCRCQWSSGIGWLCRLQPLIPKIGIVSSFCRVVHTHTHTHTQTHTHWPENPLTEKKACCLATSSVAQTTNNFNMYFSWDVLYEHNVDCVTWSLYIFIVLLKFHLWPLYYILNVNVKLIDRFFYNKTNVLAVNLSSTVMFLLSEDLSIIYSKNTNIISPSYRK